MDEKTALQAENIQILHRLQFLLTKASLSDLSLSSHKVGLLPHYQVLICRTHVLLQLYQFRNEFQTQLANKGSYKISIGRMRLRVTELQANYKQANEIKADTTKKKGWEDINDLLHFQGLSYVLEIICTKLIGWHYNDPLKGHFGIEKTRELVARKYY